jgi:hypothetical protein
MRAPKVCLVSVLITTLTLVAAGHGQTTNTQFGTAGINAIDADPKPCNSVGRTSPDTEDSANHPGPKPHGKRQNLSNFRRYSSRSGQSEPDCDYFAPL